MGATEIGFVCGVQITEELVQNMLKGLIELFTKKKHAGKRARKYNIDKIIEMLRAQLSIKMTPFQFYEWYTKHFDDKCDIELYWKFEWGNRSGVWLVRERNSISTYHLKNGSESSDDSADNSETVPFEDNKAFDDFLELAEIPRDQIEIHLWSSRE